MYQVTQGGRKLSIYPYCPMRSDGVISHTRRRRRVFRQRDQLAVAKFSMSVVWDRVTEGSTLIFADTQISLEQSVG